MTTIQLSLFGEDRVLTTTAPATRDGKSTLSKAGAVALQMYEVVRRLVPGSDRDAFNCLVRIWADMVRLRPLLEEDRPVAAQVVPLMPALVRALEEGGFYDPLGEVFTKAGLGGKGQILTPRWIVEYIVEQTVGRALDERPDRLPVTVLDPCTGTGRFLVVAAQMYGPRLGHRLWLYGVELDPDLYRACLVNMRFVSPLSPYLILCGDALLLDVGPGSLNWRFANQWDPPDWRTMEPATPGLDLSQLPDPSDVEGEDDGLPEDDVCPSCLRPNTTYPCEECGQMICQDCEDYHICEPE